MNTSLKSGNSRRAFTKVELMVVIAIIAVLVFVLIPPVKNANESRKRIRCVSYLKQIGLSFRLFATDHKDLYPMQISTNEGGTLEFVGSGETFRHLVVLSNELNTPFILKCLADDESRSVASSFTNDFNNKNISYFIGLDAYETNYTMFLAGDRHIEIDSQRQIGAVNLGTNQSVGWITKNSHKLGGNVAFADGSVQQLTTSGLKDALLNTGDLTNRVSIPD